MLIRVWTTLNIDDELQPFELEHGNGVPTLPRGPNDPVVTAELVNGLLDEDE
jgi:hypothetical protein